MKIMITGAGGQLANALIRNNPKLLNKQIVKIIKFDKKQLDINNFTEVEKNIQFFKPDWIINTAAYTKVDQAEKEFNNALDINSKAVEFISKIIKNKNIKLLHISTDFVFSGKKNTPYKPKDERDPINKYGLSKSLGEDAIIKTLKGSDQAIILRTSWLMGSIGDNFLTKIIKLSNEKKTLRVVNDQIGSPTSLTSLASICWKIIEHKEKGFKLPLLLHWCDPGITSWYEIACFIVEYGANAKLIRNPPKIIAVKSNEFPSIAKRPCYSALDSSETYKLLGIKKNHWTSNLKKEINQLKE